LACLVLRGLKFAAENDHGLFLGWGMRSDRKERASGSRKREWLLRHALIARGKDRGEKGWTN